MKRPVGLSVVPPIEDCSQCPFGALSSACPLHEIERPPGTVLVEQGLPPPRMWFLKRGTVLLSAVSAGGDELLCALRGPGSLLGIEALRDAPAASQAWALSEVTLCGIDAPAFRAWLGDRATPLGAVLELAITEAGRRSEERVALAGRSAARLARFLIERRRIEGRDRPLRIQHRLLARMLGMRPETLSRAIARLRSTGALAPGPGVRIGDPDSLEREAGEAAGAPVAGRL